MLLRRFILVLMLVALGACAVVGMLAVFIRSPRQFESIIAAAVSVGVAMALLLPLTFLVDRPKFRAGGIGLMVVVVLALLCVLGLCASEAMPWPYRRTLEDASLIALGFVSFVAAPGAGGLLLDRFPWARIAVRFFAGAAVFSIMLGILGAITVRTDHRLSEVLAIGAGMAAVLGLISAILLVNVGQGDKRYFRFPALALVGVIAVLTSLLILYRGNISRHLEYAFGVLLVVTSFCAHINLLLMAKVKPAFVWLLWLTILASAICGSFIILGVLYDDTETIVGFGLASGIATLCGSLALVVLTLLNRRFDYRDDATPSSLLRDIQLTCPRCSKPQTLPLGDSLCCQCGLKFSIQATEPQCLQCGYLLYGISTPRCPECGAEVPTGAAAPPASEPVPYTSTALASDR